MSARAPFAAAPATAPAAATTSASATAAHLDAWLASDAVQRADGAVAGIVSEDGRIEYGYPEIAGYYLRWLAWRAASAGTATDVLRRRAEATQRWLAGCLAGERAGAPPTRVHADGTTRDWRNDAVFTFDLAMVLRGLASASEQRLIEPEAPLVAALARELERLIAHDGELDACRVHANAAPGFPDRWSTQRGPFLAKAAAGIVAAARQLSAIPPRLVDAANATFDASLDALRTAPHPETHPLLYAIEGYLDEPAHPGFARRLPAIGACFERLVERCEALGRVPEIADGSGAARLDIVAQALRAGLLLDHHRGRPAHGLHATLVATLQDAAGDDAAMPFVRDATPRRRNTWATMFASQALAWHDAGARGQLADVARAPLIV